tara:strand:+ start:581 stop:880 length:300 start_codon:yes stop_codon:yes gene_type:complete
MITSNGLNELGFTAGVDFVLQNDGAGTYIREWISSEPQPTEAAIETAHGLWQTEWDSQEYARKRKPEYPSIEECVHAILDDDLVALQTKRSAVKAKYPK